MAIDRTNSRVLHRVAADSPWETPEEGRPQGIQLPTPCDLRSGTGWAFIEGKGVRPYNCRLEERKAKLIEDARIPQLYRKATLQSYQLTEPIYGRCGLSIMRTL